MYWLPVWSDFCVDLHSNFGTNAVKVKNVIFNVCHIACATVQNVRSCDLWIHICIGRDIITNYLYYLIEEHD